MDWNLAIEKNREALKRIVAMLVAMAGLGAGIRQSPVGSRNQTAQAAEARLADCLLPNADCRLPLPRHLHRAILRLLRPAESAVRRLVIVMARGLVVTLAPPRPRKPAGADLPRQARRHRHPDAAGLRAGAPAPRTSHARPAAARPAQALPPQAEAAGRERCSAHLVSRRHRAVSRRAPPPARARRSARRGPPGAPPPGARRSTRRPAATGKALRPLAGRPQRCLPVALAASGRCVRAARPASARRGGARTRCTRSCTTSTAWPSTCWSIPTRREAWVLPRLRGRYPKGRRGRGLEWAAHVFARP